MHHLGEVTTRALARQQAESLARFLHDEQIHSVQLVALAASTLGQGIDAAKRFLYDYVDEMACTLVASDAFSGGDDRIAKLDALLSALGQGLYHALRTQPWAEGAINEAIESARERHLTVVRDYTSACAAE